VHFWRHRLIHSRPSKKLERRGDREPQYWLICGAARGPYVVPPETRLVWAVCMMGKLVVTSWLVVTSGLSMVMYWLAMSVVGLAAPNHPHKFLPVFLFPVVILLPVWILFPVLRSYLDLPALVTGLPWRRTVSHQDGSRRVSDRFLGALGRNPTCRTGRCNLRYGLDESPYLLPAYIIVKLLTDSGKIEQTFEARMCLFTVTASLKTTGFLYGNVGIDRGNLTLTARIFVG